MVVFSGVNLSCAGGELSVLGNGVYFSWSVHVVSGLFFPLLAGESEETNGRRMTVVVGCSLWP